MNAKLIMHIASIVTSIGIVLYAAYRQGHKKYSFWYIIIRYIRHGDTEPLKWLMQNTWYIVLWFLAIGQLITISGLLRDFGNGRIDSKPMEFFFSAPMTKVCVIYLIHELAKMKSPSYRKKVESVVRGIEEFATRLTSKY